MSLRVVCDCCKIPMTEPGGLAFSPPDDLIDVVVKYHLCRACWRAFAVWFVSRQEGSAT